MLLIRSLCLRPALLHERLNIGSQEAALPVWADLEVTDLAGHCPLVKRARTDAQELRRLADPDEFAVWRH